MTNSYSKLVEQYLDGEMSSAEVANFEQMRSQDPLLANEFNSQQEIINGVKAFRQAELKMRLSNIDVTPGLFQTITGSTALQATSVALLTGIVFIGSYWWVETTDKAESIDISINSKTKELTTSTFNQNIQEEIPLIELHTFNTTSKADEIKTIEIEEEPEETAKAVDIAMPDVMTPTLADAESDEDILPNIEESVSIKTREAKTYPVEIENITSTKKSFQYKYYNNKLFLYGDFNGIPYEVLEINNRSGKRLFLYHNNLFYRIDEIKKSSPLKLVTNNNLIEELMILKENKSE